MPRLSIVVPAYNEGARLPMTLPKLAQFCERHGSVEVLIVDDGSRDSTAAIVQEFVARYPFARILQNPGNRGKGYSVRHGMQKAQGDWILSTDADLSSPLEEVDKLMAAVDREQAAGAIGSRALDRSLVGVHQAAFREWSGRAFNVIMRAATGLPFRDTQCGFKLFRRDAAEVIFRRQLLEGFGFDVEDLLIARIHGFKVVEVPVRWDNVEGTKVGTLTGARAFWDLVVVRWNQLCGRYR
ncbi:MAG TPA: dolichyl-phosphate beta-glucosyltransferase [Bryobacteraceae bacterium]|nr:dolichyl-phosphate beta-glucosyltransferase [Bryobacteraceae bacterium]